MASVTQHAPNPLYLLGFVPQPNYVRYGRQAPHPHGQLQMFRRCGFGACAHAAGSGHGSEGPGSFGLAGSGYSIDLHCKDILAVLDDLGIEKTALLGHSLGGYIAPAFAHKHPERVERLVLMDAGSDTS